MAFVYMAYKHFPSQKHYIVNFHTHNVDSHTVVKLNFALRDLLCLSSSC